MNDTEIQKPQRLTALERAAKLRADAKQREAKAQVIEARERTKADDQRTRKLIVLGGAVVAEARNNPAFRQQLIQVVEARVVRPVDLKTMEGWESII